MADAAVVIPFRGEWNHLAPLIQSLKDQTVRNKLEIVLSLDGMEDPPDWVEEAFDLVVSGPQAGPASARNRGWRSSAAPIILFTDADCVPEPVWAECLIDALGGKYQAVKGVYSSGGGCFIQRLAQVEFMERYRIMEKRDSIFLADTYSAGFVREWLEKLDGFNQSFPLPEHEDVDLSWRLVENGGCIGFVPGARVSHTHRDSWFGYFRMKVRRGKWRIMLVRSFPEMAFSDGYTPQNLKVQMLLLPAIVLMPFILPSYSWISWVLFLLSTLPITTVGLSTDRRVTPLIPVFCIWRSAALLAGSLAGIFSRRRF